MLGQVGSATQGVDRGYAFRRMLYAAYIQDDWHAAPRLTINAGLRWDYMSQAVEKHNGIEDFDITKTNPLNGYAGAVEYAGVNGEGRNFVPENYGDYGPRLGFAYSLTPDGKTVVRGGVGIYYATVNNFVYDYSSGNYLGFTSYTTSYSAPTAKGYDFFLKGGFPTPWNTPLGVAGGQNAFLGQSAAYIWPKAKDPTSQQFTLTVRGNFRGTWLRICPTSATMAIISLTFSPTSTHCLPSTTAWAPPPSVLRWQTRMQASCREVSGLRPSLKPIC